MSPSELAETQKKAKEAEAAGNQFWAYVEENLEVYHTLYEKPETFYMLEKEDQLKAIRKMAGGLTAEVYVRIGTRLLKEAQAQAGQ